jgi:O-methyltransferase domain
VSVSVTWGDRLDGVRKRHADADAYLLTAILHDWDDDRAAAILGRIRAARAPHARVLAGPFVLEHFPSRLNRRGFPNRVSSDSTSMLAEEAGMHGQGAVG